MITLEDTINFMPAGADHSERVRSLLNFYRLGRATDDAASLSLFVRELEYASESPRINIDDALRTEIQRELSLLNRPMDNN